MKYFAECLTIREDKTEVIYRKACLDRQHAMDHAFTMVQDGFGNQVTYPICYAKGESPWFSNDFGEWCTIYWAGYHHAAQITEGVFEL